MSEETPIAPVASDESTSGGGPAKAYPSLLGICKGLGLAPSAGDFEQARREMWTNFPQDDSKIRASDTETIW